MATISENKADKGEQSKTLEAVQNRGFISTQKTQAESRCNRSENWKTTRSGDCSDQSTRGTDAVEKKETTLHEELYPADGRSALPIRCRPRGKDPSYVSSDLHANSSGGEFDRTIFSEIGNAVPKNGSTRREKKEASIAIGAAPPPQDHGPAESGPPFPVGTG